MFLDNKMSIISATVPVHPHPSSRPTYLTGPWNGDSNAYDSDQWFNNSRGSSLAGGFNHAYSASSFYPVRAAYPAEQPEIVGGNEFPGSAPSGRNMKLNSEHLPVVGVC